MTEDAKGARILIIEDEALIAREIKHRLTNMGWEVVGTAFGEESVEMAVETQPDLLLSDIHLRHGLSGIDLAQRIQQKIDVPVVFLTAYSDEDTVARAKQVTPYGYIIKPVDNRDLQITIEMALYKFRMEKELRQKQQLLETAFACIGDALIFMDGTGHVSDINDEAQRLVGAGVQVGDPWHHIFDESGSASDTFETSIRKGDVARIPPFLLQREDQSTSLVDCIVGPTDEGAVLILRDLGDIEDPVALGSPDTKRSELGSDQILPTESSFCQLLISPDDLDDFEASGVVTDVRRLLDPHLRSTDLASLLANTMVSISLPYTSPADGEQIAEQLLEQLSDYQLGSRDVTFSAGLAHSSGGDQQPIELFRRAASALDIARRSGGGRLWVEGRSKSPSSREFQGSKDYRHVILLWNVMNSLARAESQQEMCAEFCQHLYQVFLADRVALIRVEGGRLTLEVGFLKGKDQTEHISDLGLNESEFSAVLSLGRATTELPEETQIINISDERVLLCSATARTAEDRDYLQTLCTYFSSSLQRFAVPAAAGADRSVDGTSLIYQSAAMTQVLETADLAAPTDATVLLTGESGTGKEMVSHYIHAHSDRSQQPMVVVDCGAVAPSLIESELFGHVKGAFTGATSNFSGRLKEADGGTVLLDEIGELPLETQVKLLRFVQERQVAAVGSNQYESVDARVIAATNRDLKEMVAEGTFREDLFYRLNVFTIAIPPLKDRREDIMELANHFLAMFAERYRKPVRAFSEDARQTLMGYHWPGNIRELQNVVNRAVILTKESKITPIHLGVFQETEQQDPEVALPSDWIEILRSAVDLGAVKRNPLPVGRYLEEDFILMSISQHDGVLNRASMTIGMPETTLRRKMQKIEEIYGSADPDRPIKWPVTSQLYEGLLKASEVEGAGPLEVLTDRLIEEIENRKLSKTLAARLMDVSLPTYRRLIT